ncbi:MAG TPA: HNH endonuclease [Anaeromyxobacteraceae bacterium]|nr:HNH endonuclease [Anaeromyxobacteraceae bacterium]
MNDLARLDARSFHSRLGDLLRAEFVALGAFLQALVAFDQRRLFRDLGYASLFEYLNRGLGLSRAASHHRRAAARLVQQFPEVLEPIEQGKLCFTTASLLATVMTGENRAEVLPRFFGLSKQEALEVAAELRPREVVPARTVVTRIEAVEAAEPTAPTAVPETLLEITEEFGRIVHPGELAGVRATPPATRTSPMTTVEPMTATVSRLHVTVSREFLALLKKARAGESHRNPGATDEHILKLALEALIEKQSKRKASVPAKVKREVVTRDEGKCQWKLPDGSVCGATARLEIDHVVPRGKGGPSTIDNCRILCKGHNLEAARQAYGDEVMDLFTQGTRPPVAHEPAAGYGARPATTVEFVAARCPPPPSAPREPGRSRHLRRRVRRGAACPTPDLREFLARRGVVHRDAPPDSC